VLFGEHLAQRAATMGERILAGMRPWVESIPCVHQVRGLGLMIGIELNRPGAEVVRRCEERGLLLNCTVGNVVRMLPPLNVLEDEVDTALQVLRGELEREGD
jgi:acetylornithine/N-succinyldiaminopimelate aminotransferase